MRSQSTYLNDGRTEGRTDGRTQATLNALPHSTNSGGIKIVITLHQYIFLRKYPAWEKGYKMLNGLADLPDQISSQNIKLQQRTQVQLYEKNSLDLKVWIFSYILL